MKRKQDLDVRWLTVEEICEYLSVTNETVYKWIDQQQMPGHRVGRRWMFKKAEVDAWVKSGAAAVHNEKDNEN